MLNRIKWNALFALIFFMFLVTVSGLCALYMPKREQHALMFVHENLDYELCENTLFYMNEWMLNNELDTYDDRNALCAYLIDKVWDKKYMNDISYQMLVLNVINECGGSKNFSEDAKNYLNTMYVYEKFISCAACSNSAFLMNLAESVYENKIVSADIRLFCGMVRDNGNANNATALNEFMLALSVANEVNDSTLNSISLIFKDEFKELALNLFSLKDIRPNANVDDLQMELIYYNSEDNTLTIKEVD